jgi:hypothetical protein
VFCACDAKQLFSIVLCVVTDVHKFEIRLAISETREKFRPAGKVYAVILEFLKGSTRFPPTVVGDVKGIYPRCSGQLHSLQSRTALPPSSRWMIKPLGRETIWKKDSGLGRVNRQALVHVPSSVLSFSCTLCQSCPMTKYVCSLGIWLSDQKALIPVTIVTVRDTNLTNVLTSRFNKHCKLKLQMCIGYRRENPRTRIIVCISVIMLFPSSRVVGSPHPLSLSLSLTLRFIALYLSPSHLLPIFLFYFSLSFHPAHFPSRRSPSPTPSSLSLPPSVSSPTHLYT